LPAPSPRRANISNIGTPQTEEGGAWAELGGSGGSVRSGLNWIQLDAGRHGPPAHCHSAEEEIFVVRGVGQIARLEPLSYNDGEPED
jgi:uncharacterized cupin superfamily protein